MDDDRLTLLVDSGRPNDPVHIVRLRDAPDGSRRGAIRGPLPDSFVHGDVTYARSGFTQRNAHGELEHTYSVASGLRYR